MTKSTKINPRKNWYRENWFCQGNKNKFCYKNYLFHRHFSWNLITVLFAGVTDSHLKNSLVIFGGLLQICSSVNTKFQRLMFTIFRHTNWLNYCYLSVVLYNDNKKQRFIIFHLIRKKMQLSILEKRLKYPQF